ncbi:hypothetical protein R1sor_013275 [Riccia sorocarpa]|uniref:Major facilitator superfamily (MFS) profile domain-containing protein n=1 Tax=Riccia sorocarpa TaxID=122646 RepID=A0ABD3HA52_9MARC
MVGSSVLTSLDKAKTQSYHFKAIIISGMGFFTDAYDLFSISNLTRLLGRIYYFKPGSSKPGVLPANVNAAVTGVALCGTLAGQLFFGWAGDKFGRKKVYGITLMIMVLASIASGLSFGSSATGVMVTLCFFRFWLGFGIGGDYPLSATIMSEYANKKNRGAFVAAVFAMQGVGLLTAAAVSVIVTAIFDSAFKRPSYEVDPIRSTPPQADYVWRIVLMFGAVPAALTFYSRSKMPETARYTALVEQNAEKARRDMEKVLNQQFDPAVMAQIKKEKPYGLFSREFARRHGRELLGTTTTWFFLDIAFYSQNLFQKDIFTAVGWLPAAASMSALEETFKVSRAQALIALVSTVPGYWFTVAFIDKVGRKPIQLMGFFFMTLFMFILTFDYYNLRGNPCANHKFCGGNHLAFIVLYAFTFFFANFGPNTTTFIVPAELFPARLRSTCHGISSACGKAGAIVGAFGFLYASQSKSTPDAGYPKGIGIKNSLLLLGITNCLGFFFTFFIPETKGKSLEDLSGENDQQAQDEMTRSNSRRIRDGADADGASTSGPAIREIKCHKGGVNRRWSVIPAPGQVSRQADRSGSASLPQRRSRQMLRIIGRATDKKKKVAKLYAKKQKTVPLPTFLDSQGNPQHLRVFLNEPEGRKCMLNTKTLQKYEDLGDNIFRCYLPKIEFLNFEVAPVIDLLVAASEDNCQVELLSCKFEGSEVVRSQNDRFSASLKNHLTWSVRQSQEILNVNLELNVALEVYTLPFTLLPVSAVETPGNLIMQSLVDRLVPLFLENMFNEYQAWAKSHPLPRTVRENSDGASTVLTPDI